MSERLLRHKLESVYGVRSAVHVRGSHVWRVSVYTLDPSQREADIARRFGYALSTWAASIKWNDHETNTPEWLDGLRERIERVQAHGEQP